MPQTAAPLLLKPAINIKMCGGALLPKPSETITMTLRRPVTRTHRNFPPYTMRHTRKQIFFSTARRRCVLAVALRLTLLATRPCPIQTGQRQAHQSWMSVTPVVTAALLPSGRTI